MSGILPFSFEGHEVRVVPGAEPHWVAADVCAVLEIAETHRAISRLDADEKGRHTVTTPGGKQEVTIINESGLWSLVLTSRKPEAKRFKKWLTSEVIPAIRKTGGYMIATPEETPEQLALRAMNVLHETVERQKLQLAEALPKAEGYDRIANAEGAISITEGAKALQMRPKDLFDWLGRNGWIYKRPGSAHWLGYQVRCNAGDLVHKVTTLLKPDGTEKVSEQVKITPQGLAKLAKLLPSRLRAAA